MKPKRSEPRNRSGNSLAAIDGFKGKVADRFVKPESGFP